MTFKGALCFEGYPAAGLLSALFCGIRAASVHFFHSTATGEMKHYKVSTGIYALCNAQTCWVLQRNTLCSHNPLRLIDGDDD